MRVNDNTLIHSCIPGEYVSDHCLITLKTCIKNQRPLKKVITYRKIRDINLDSFNNDILQSDLHNFNINITLNKMVTYDSLLATILNNHTPLINKTIYLRKDAPWYNNTLLKQKREKDVLQRTSEDQKQMKWTLFKSKLSKYIIKNLSVIYQMIKLNFNNFLSLK